MQDRFVAMAESRVRRVLTDWEATAGRRDGSMVSILGMGAVLTFV